MSGDQPQALFSYINYMPKVQERKANKTISCIFFYFSEVVTMGWMGWAAIALIAVIFVVNFIVCCPDLLPWNKRKKGK